ncbi:MAG: hypothetical protein AB1757_07395 [Acidobacteriota bacterium]
MSSKTLCMLTCFFLTASTIFAQDGVMTTHVDFEKGKTSARFERKIDLMNPHRYLIPVKEGQVLGIKLNGKQIHLRLIAPSESTLIKLETQTKMKGVTEIAKETGDYLLWIQCFCAGRSERYKLDISVK